MNLSDTFAAIRQKTLETVHARKEQTPTEVLKKALGTHTEPTRSFINTLTHHVGEGNLGLIAELKKASPLSGTICRDYNPKAIAKAYEAGGACCLSVYTEHLFFQGSPDDLKTVRVASKLPVLRKELILDPWQVYESRVIGADCIMLIMSALEDEQARELEDLARSLDLDVYIQIHTQEDLSRALGLQSSLIGVSNRSADNTLDPDITVALAPLIPPDRFVVAEGGISGREDILRLAEVGVRSFIIGESLMREGNIEEAVKDLLYKERF